MHPVCVELERVDLDAKRRYIFLLELASQVTLHEGRLAHASVTHKHELCTAHQCHLSDSRIHPRGLGEKGGGKCGARRAGSGVLAPPSSRGPLTLKVGF